MVSCTVKGVPNSDLHLLIPMRTRTRPTGYLLQLRMLLCALVSGAFPAAPAVAQTGELKQTILSGDCCGLNEVLCNELPCASHSPW